MPWLRQLLHWHRRNESVPSAVRSMVDLAYSYIRHGDCPGARELLLKALTRRDEIRDTAAVNRILELLAWTWTVTDQHREKVDFFSQYLSRYPKDVGAHTLRAGALWYAGELEQAVADYSAALELDPNEILARMGRGQVYAESGEYGRALDDLDFVLENLDRYVTEDPSRKAQLQAFSFNGRAVAHAGIGDFERAMAEFDRSIALWPDNAWVYFNRGTVYEKKGDVEKAVADYTLSLQKNLPKLNVLKNKYAEVKIKALIS
jgi:tetratricopeptide (TPR) repeat protein